MGIINVTPDSFSDGGRHAAPAAAAAAAARMAAAGADWLDVGGESTRPGAAPVSEADELARVIPAITSLASSVRVPISVDTSRGAVARAALAAGARMINDVRGGADPALLRAVADRGAELVLMHMQGDPASMQTAPHYDDVVQEVAEALSAALDRAVAAGVDRERIWLDPGIGFGKRVEHNLALLRALPRLADTLGRPLVVGVSRKSLIPALIGRAVPADERDAASHVLHALLASDCAMLRVHDVAGAAEALRIAAALRGGP